MYQLAWHVDDDPYALLLLRGRSRDQLLEPPPAPDVVLGDVSVRAAEILRLSGNAPAGHGLADSTVAAYDEEVSRLL